MKKLTLLVAAMITLNALNVAAANETATNPVTESYTVVGNDFKVIKDEVKGGIRYVTAVPSAKVCSKQIDIEIEVKTHKIQKCVFTRGCPGNAIGLCRLIEGKTIEETAKTLEGINCSGRGTSCPDQLSRVLKSLKW